MILKGNKNEDNKLIKVTVGDKIFFYNSWEKTTDLFTTTAPNLRYYCFNEKPIKTKDGDLARIELIDGSEVPYKEINKTRKV